MDEYKGRVKSVKRFFLHAKDGQLDFTELELHNDYDENGNVVINRAFERGEELRWDNIYDDNGKKIESNYKYNNSNEKNTFKYNQYGDLIEQCCYKDSKLSYIGKYKYEYDESGKMISQHTCDNSWYFYKYNKDGLIIEKLEKRSDKDNDPAWKVTYQYDQHGQLIEEADYNAENRLVRKETFRYDEDGHIIEHCKYDDNDFLKRISGFLKYRETYKYDRNGNQTEERLYEGNNLDSYEIYKYDENGNKISKYTYNPEGILHSKIVITYDSKGNIEKLLSFDGDNRFKYGEAWEYEYYPDKKSGR